LRVSTVGVGSLDNSATSSMDMGSTDVRSGDVLHSSLRSESLLFLDNLIMSAWRNDRLISFNFFLFQLSLKSLILSTQQSNVSFQFSKIFLSDNLFLFFNDLNLLFLVVNDVVSSFFQLIFQMMQFYGQFIVLDFIGLLVGD